MHKTYLLSVVCPDRTGLISAITGELFSLGINLADANFSILGSGAEFSAVLDAPEELDIDGMRQALSALPELEQADIEIKPYTLTQLRGESGTVTHHLSLKGDDQPGLVARITELFLDYGANIVRMDTHVVGKAGGTDYAIDLWVWVPEQRAQACIAAINNTAASLGMSCDVSEAG
jgi:glycine cleavage system transcriptional repressor